MRVIKRLKQITVSLGMIGLISALFLSGLNFALGVKWEETYQEYEKTATVGANEFKFMAFTYLFISFLLLLFTIFNLVSDRILAKAIALILLVLIIFQCKILTVSKPTSFPDWMNAYSSWLHMTMNMWVFFFVLTVFLLITQVYLTWYTYRSTAVLMKYP